MDSFTRCEFVSGRRFRCEGLSKGRFGELSISILFASVPRTQLGISRGHDGRLCYGLDILLMLAEI